MSVFLVNSETSVRCVCVWFFWIFDDVDGAWFWQVKKVTGFVWLFPPSYSCKSLYCELYLLLSPTPLHQLRLHWNNRDNLEFFFLKRLSWNVVVVVVVVRTACTTQWVCTATSVRKVTWEMLAVEHPTTVSPAPALSPSPPISEYTCVRMDTHTFSLCVCVCAGFCCCCCCFVFCLCLFLFSVSFCLICLFSVVC